MIIDALINLIYFVIEKMISILPNGYNLSVNVITAFQNLGNNYYMFNVIFPVSTILVLFTASLFIAFTFTGVKVIFWIISYIRGTDSPL